MMKKIRIVFDSDLNRKSFEDHRVAIQKFPLHCQIFSDQKEIHPPVTLTKEFSVWGDMGDGNWALLYEENNNYQRQVMIDINGTYQRLKIKFHETWGNDTVRIYALDIS